MRRVLYSAVAVLAAQSAHAQGGTVVNVAESEEYGQYLTVNELPVYLFTTDTQGTDGAEAAVSCTGECLDAWPLVTAESGSAAGDGAMSDMVGTMEHDGETVVTYNGWPLYHFARDSAGNPPNGQEIESFGGEWYLIGPDGARIEGEGA